MDYKNQADFMAAFWRFKLGLYECLKSQISQNFDIVIRSNPDHFQYFIDLGCKPYSFHGDPGIQWDGSKRQKQHPSEFSQEETKGLAKYHIQTIIDYDDWVAPGFVAKIEKELTGIDHKHVLNFMPVKVDTVYLKMYKMQYYQKGKGSMFLSIFCPDLDDYFFAYSYRHLAIPRKIGSLTIIPEGYCWYIIHNHNTGNARKTSSTEEVPLYQLIANMD